MGTITIQELEVFYCVGVTPDERRLPQRLLLTVQLEQDIRAAAASDDLRLTVDYAEVVRRLSDWGSGRSWRLLESVAVEIADVLLRDYPEIQAVEVEVRKFILPHTRHVAVRYRAVRPSE